MNRLEPTVRTISLVAAPAAPAASGPRVPLAAFVALVLLGGGLRASALASDRCLWIDESMLALNLVERNPLELLKPLDRNQGAPLGFLLAVKAAVSALGASEWALRLVPFLASLAGFAGFTWLVRRLLPPAAALLAVALFALSPYLISYAAECKQYASDAAVAVGLLAVSLGLLEGGGGFRRWFVLGAAGVAAVWCSHPATFVLGGIGTALLLRAAVARDRARFAAAGLTAGCWLLSFAACYLLCLKQLGGNKYLTDYWTDHFMPANLGAASWVADHLVAFFTTPGGFGGTFVPLGGCAAALALVGLREFGRERWPLAVALAVPVGLLLVASALNKYPFGGRLLLFLIPFAVLLVTRGLWAVFEAAREKNGFAARVLVGLFVVAGAWQTRDELRRPQRYEQLAPVLDKALPEIRPADGVFVFYSAEPAFKFYTRDRQLPTPAVTFGEEHRDDPSLYQAEVEKLHGRVWVFFSHPHKHEQTMLRAMLDGRGRCERAVTAPGAAAWLYVLE